MVSVVFYCLLECISVKGRETKTKVFTTVDQSEGQFLREPIRIQRSRLQAWENAIDEVEIDCNFFASDNFLHLRG